MGIFAVCNKFGDSSKKLLHASSGRHYASFEESIADLKNPDKDCSYTPDSLLAELDSFIQKFHREFAWYSDPFCTVVFPDISQVQFDYIQKRFGTISTAIHDLLQQMKGRVYYYSYQCVTSQKLPGACPPKNLMESELLAVVSSAVHRHMDTIAALEKRVSKEYAFASSEKRRTLDRQIAQVKQEQSRSQTLLDGLYQNLVDGMLTREEYLSMKGHYQKRFDDATLRLADLGAQLQQLERYGPSNPMFAVCRTLRNTEGLIHLLVSRIEVHDGNRLDIKLVYQDEVDALLRFLREEGTSL